VTEAPKETVVVVHGTFAAPKIDDPPQWWQQDSESDPNHFTARLDAALAERGSPARCWAHYRENAPIFHWSGDNDWVERAKASSAFREYLFDLQKKGWLCHVIAHSHGGNVVLDGLSNMPGQTCVSHGKIVTLGTPFLDAMSAVLRRAKVILVIRDIALLIFSAMILYYFSGFKLLYEPYDMRFYPIDEAVAVEIIRLILSIAAFAVILILAYTYFFRNQDVDPGIAIDRSVLSISSGLDETWQLTAHIRNQVNPFLSKNGMSNYIYRRISYSLTLRNVISRLHGAARYTDFSGISATILFLSYAISAIIFLFLTDCQYNFMHMCPSGVGYMEIPNGIFEVLLCMAIVVALTLFLLAYSAISGKNVWSAYLSPLRWCYYLILSPFSAFQAIASYLVRRRAWPLVQSIALGLDNYRYPLPQVERNPTHLKAMLVTYEDLPPEVAERALARRNDWIAGRLGDVSQTFSNLVVTSADLSSLLKSIETDMTLVHGAYYTENECIARIADWIAGKG
jgi:hypothetical protein